MPHQRRGRPARRTVHSVRWEAPADLAASLDGSRQAQDRHAICCRPMSTWDELKKHLTVALPPSAHAHAQLSEATHFLADRCDELDKRVEDLSNGLQDLEERTHG